MLSKQKFRKLKLSEVEASLLRKIKEKKVKNIEIPSGYYDLTGKELMASAVNLEQKEVNAFNKLRNKGLIEIANDNIPPYFTNYKITDKGKVQLPSGKMRRL